MNYSHSNNARFHLTTLLTPCWPSKGSMALANDHSDDGNKVELPPPTVRWGSARQPYDLTTLRPIERGCMPIATFDWPLSHTSQFISTTAVHQTGVAEIFETKDTHTYPILTENSLLIFNITICSKTQIFSAPLLQIWTASAVPVKLQLTIETSRRWCGVGCDGHWLKVFFWVDVLFGKAVGSPDYLLFIFIMFVSFRFVPFPSIIFILYRQTFLPLICMHYECWHISSSFLASVPARSCSSIKIAWAAIHYAYLFWQWGQNLVLLHSNIHTSFGFHEIILILLFFSYYIPNNLIKV